MIAMLLFADGNTGLISRIQDIRQEDSELRLNVHVGSGGAQRLSQQTAELKPDVVILDPLASCENIPELSQVVHQSHSAAKVVTILQTADEWTLTRLLASGVCGLLPDIFTNDEFHLCLSTVVDDRLYLSPQVSYVHSQGIDGPTPITIAKLASLTARERQVLVLVASGASTRSIAQQLYISEKTVESHRRHITRKLKLHSTAELTKFALLHGITSLNA